MATYYFDADNGNDANDGLTRATAKRSYDVAVSGGFITGLPWGQQFLFKRGALQVVTTARQTKNGLVSNRTVYGAYGEAQIPYARWTGTFVASTNSALVASGSEYVTFEDQWFDKNGVSLQSSAGSNTINPIVRRCRFSNMMGTANKLSGVELNADLGSAFTVLNGIIEDCEVYGSGGHGIVASGVANAIIRRNKCWNNGLLSSEGGHGISVIPSRTTLISTGWSGAGPVYTRTLTGVETNVFFVKNATTNTILTRNTVTPTTPGSGEWGFSGGVLYVNLGGASPNTQTMGYVWRRCTGVLVYHNDVSTTYWQAGQSPFREGTGIQLDDMSDACFVFGNYVHDNTGTGVAVNGGPNNIIVGNWIENNGRSGIGMNGANVLVANNTVIRNMTNPSADLGEIAISRPHSVNPRFINNIVIGRRPTLDRAVQIDDVAASATVQNLRAANVLELYSAGVGSVSDALLMPNVESYLDSSRRLLPTIDIGGIPFRNPLDGAGTWVQGGRTFDGAPLMPGRVPIGAKMPSGRMP